MLGPDVAVTIAPNQVVAPVGSEVVLLASVRGADGYLHTSRRLEWSIAPGSVGLFVTVGQFGFVDWLLSDLTIPRKISNTYAIGTTVRNPQQVGRGGPPTAVLPGQGWISVGSPIEGDSVVTVAAPEVVVPAGRAQSAVIHWIDARFSFPPPAISPAGSRHVLCTTVLRQTSPSPHVGWLVRYEIVGGPPAGFAPTGARVSDVITNAAGQATVEIFQEQPANGTSQISIHVFRPADPGQGGDGWLAGTGSVLQTWTAAGLTVHKSGPATAAVGATLTYRIEVGNPGDLPVKDVVANDELPDTLPFVAGTPPPEIIGKRLQWRLGDLGPRQTRAVEFNVRAAQPGSIANCVEVTTAGGMKANDCVTTTILASNAPPATLDVKLSGPMQATVGDKVTFEATITNLGQIPAAGLIIKDRFDPGLKHAVASSPIERDLGELGPGQSRRISITFRVTAAGRLCQTLEVLGPGGVRVSADACVTAAEAPGPTAEGPAKPGQPPAGPLSVTKKGPQQLKVGETAKFTIEIVNDGTQPLTNLKVTDRCDPGLVPARASEGYKVEGNDLVWSIPSLPPGKLPLQAEYHCTKAGAKLTNRVSVVTQDGTHAEAEIALEVTAAAAPAPEIGPAEPKPAEAKPAAPGPAESRPGGLSIAVADLRNPVAVGKGLTYQVHVTNKTAAPDQDLAVVATVPAGMMAVAFGTRGPGSTTYTMDNRTIRFSPVPQIKAGETLTYEIHVQTRQVGRFQMHVEVTSKGHPQPLIGEKLTDVFQ
jgi:uncharacterized repeat protein (TIGR01451 family)